MSHLAVQINSRVTNVSDHPFGGSGKTRHPSRKGGCPGDPRGRSGYPAHQKVGAKEKGTAEPRYRAPDGLNLANEVFMRRLAAHFSVCRTIACSALTFFVML